MARLKKHIRKKKAIIRKQIKRTNNRNQSHNTKTAEQQSRDNEMLKVMLGRPQQIIPGQTQQNDKLQQQIETTNKAIGDIKQENISLKNHLQFLRSQKEEAQREQHQIIQENNQREEIRDNAEQNFKRKEELQKRGKELDKQIEELNQRQKDLQGESEIGEINKQIHAIQLEKRKIEDEIKALKEKLSKNALYKRYEEEKLNVANLQAEQAALNNLLQSNEFKNPSAALTNILTKKLLEEQALNTKREVIKTQEEINHFASEKKAYEDFVKQYEQPTAKLLYTLDKGTAKEKKVYEKNNLTGPSLKAQDEASLAEQLVEKTKTEQELYTAKNKFDSARKLQREVINATTENKEKETELNIKSAYLKSEGFKQDLLNNELEKRKLYNEQQRQQILETKANTSRQLTEINARNEIAQHFDPMNTKPDGVIAQINELGSEAIAQLSNINNALNVENQRRSKVKEFGDILDAITSKYENPVHAAKARQNVFNLIEHKTEGKLDDDIANYQLENITKAVEFGNKLLSLNAGVLINDNQFEGFKDHPDFKNFQWKPI